MRRAIGGILIGLIFATTGCQKSASVAPPAGPKSPSGWQVRYNAVQALAHRGSLNIKDPVVWDQLLEMLDEDQQLRNFTQSRGGRDVCDATAARLTIIGALAAVTELHRRQPGLDLSGLREPIEKLTQSSNAQLGIRAKNAKLALGQ